MIITRIHFILLPRPYIVPKSKDRIQKIQANPFFKTFQTNSTFEADKAGDKACNFIALNLEA